MGDIDRDTQDWLNSIKLGHSIHYFTDLQNGYLLGLIFDRLNLSKGRKFKNTKDMACKFQNFKNIRDLLYENFRVQFPIQNILFNTEALLMTIKECVQQYSREKKQATFKRISTLSESKIQPHEQQIFNRRQQQIISSSKLNQTSKFPRKIQEIELKLSKFKEMKSKHELIALQDRKNELEEHRRLVEQHRLYEMNKIRTNHDFIKEHQRKVFDVCDKTMQVRTRRIEIDNNLQSFLEQKKRKFYQSLRDEQSNNFKEGLEAFQLNCIRQGIQLQHDPSKPLRKTQEGFNKQVVLERIKDNVKVHDHERKERIKRQNKKAVDARQANSKAETIWNENSLVQNYANHIKKHLEKTTAIRKEISREEAQKANIISKIKGKKIVQLVGNEMDEQVRNQQYRKRKIQYLDEQVVRLQRRQKKHRVIAENALQALISMVIESQDKYRNNNGFTFFQWKEVEKQFLGYTKQEKKSKDKSKFIDNSYQNRARDFICNQGDWKLKGHSEKEIQLSNALQFIIDKAYPRTMLPQKTNLPLYMPLKISFIGDPLSGKTAVAQKLASKYAIIFINPVHVLQQAFQLIKQPVVEDPKKKKDSKKPQEENPQKLALKEWGEKIFKNLQNPSLATIQHYLEAIKFKLNYYFQNKGKAQILKQFDESRVQQGQRLGKALKEYQQVQKKGKKDAKKGGAQQVDEPPSQRKYFYTKGFLIDGINLDKEALSAIQQRLNGFLSFEQTINKQGESLKYNISNIIPVKQAQKDSKFQPGFFDLLFELQVKNQVLQSRAASDKKQLLNLNKQQIQAFYADFGQESLKVKAYHKIKNEGTIQECLIQISKVIEHYLDLKYEEILSSKKAQEQPVLSQSNQLIQDPILSLCSLVQQKNSQKLVLKLIVSYQTYHSKVLANISDYDNERRSFEAKFLQIQQNFINIINRPDDKAGKILNFQQNYNKLLSEKTNIVKDTQASKHLVSKLDELYNNLWISLQGKKNQAVNQRISFLSSQTLNNEIHKLVEISKRLIQNQLSLLIDIIFFIYNLNGYASGSNEDILTQYLILGIPPEIQLISSFQSTTFTSPRLQYYITQAQTCLRDLPSWLIKKQKKFKIIKREETSVMLSELVETTSLRIQQKMKNIRAKMTQMYLQYFAIFNVLANKMDDWIIQGIKAENQFVYDIYKAIKKNIQEAKRSSIKDLFVKDITDIIHPLYNIPINRLPVTVVTPAISIKLLSFTIFMQEIKCLATNGRIPFKLFTTYFEKRKKSKLLEQQLLNLQFDLTQQYLVTDQYLNCKQISLAMLLWNVEILDEDRINEYERSLRVAKAENGEYFKEKITLQEFVMIPGVTTNQQESDMLKTYLFEIFCEDHENLINIKEYLETLRVFCQLQVFKYGDTIILQRHSPSRHQKRA